MDFFGVLVFFFKHRLQPGIFEEPLPSPIKGRLCQSFPQQKNTHPKKKKRGCSAVQQPQPLAQGRTELPLEPEQAGSITQRGNGIRKAKKDALTHSCPWDRRPNAKGVATTQNTNFSLVITAKSFEVS